MTAKRLCLYTLALIAALIFAAYLSAFVASAQEDLRPDTHRALDTRAERGPAQTRKGGYSPLGATTRETRPRSVSIENESSSHLPARTASTQSVATGETPAAVTTPIRTGTPLHRILHTSELSISSTAGTDEEFTDRTNDLVADDRTTFDRDGGSFDIAVGRSGARYEVYSATLSGKPVGALVVALDTNGDFLRDSATVYNLQRDFNLPSAVAVVSGTSKAGREFVIVSSSGYYNFNNPNDPNNEPSAGVVLLVRDSSASGFDTTLSRELVKAGSNQLNNANALALMPNNDLLIADFDSDELRIVRDTNSDGIPDTLDSAPYYSYRFSDDQPLDIAVNSRGVVLSHSIGNNTVLLAIYDDNHDGRADHDEVVAEGLSIDNNLVFHGLTVDREGTIYVIEDASGAADTPADGGNGGTPRIDAFADPNQDGFLRDGKLYAVADIPNSQALSGLAFVSLPPNQINDTQVFVTQHYRDFLNREPDSGGLAYWSSQIDGNCKATDLTCLGRQRISVSAAYFIETEFQETGYFVYRLYRAALGRRPTFSEFTADRALINPAPSQIEASKQSFADAFVQRASFTAAYPSSMTPDQFVNKLFDMAGLVPFTAQRQQLIADMNNGKTRARVLRDVIEITEFRQREYNGAFVVMQYFGYLRRDPDDGGYGFWLNVLNNKEPNNYRGMVCSFITSAEYQDRFGLQRVRSNADCAGQ